VSVLRVVDDAMQHALSRLTTALANRTFEEAIVLLFYALALAFLLPFAVVRGLNGQWLHVAIEALGAGIVAILGYTVWRSRRVHWAGPVTAVVFLGLVVVVVHLFGTRMLFWAYPLSATTFFLLRPVNAAALNLVTAVAISPVALELGLWTGIAGFYAALLATNCLALAVITAMSDSRRRVKTMAQRDELTHLPNRRLLVHRIEELIEAADDQPVALLLLDLDEFKLVNDTLGHAAGDKLLQQVAARLRECVRASDTVSRFGGDEFVVVMGLSQTAEAGEAAHRILAALAPPFLVDGHEVAGRPSIGVSLFPEDGRSAGDLLQAADTAMYAAKREDTNQYRYFAASMNHEVRERVRIEAELSEALERHDLVLYYQPRVRMVDGAVVATEALVRWQHREGGLLLPSAFLPVAEQSAIMGAIDRYVLTHAARQASAWQRNGVAMPISVNLSARELHRDGLGAEFADLLTAGGADPSYIEVEITESSVMRDFAHANRQLRDLKHRAPGIRIALDDFGSGYSSLQYLRQLPIDTLKIDHSFVADLDHCDETGWAIARTIVELGDNLGLKVVAEGVERAEQVDMLRKLGCREAQGFGYARPMSAGDFAEWLAGRRAMDSTALDEVAPSRQRACRAGH